MPIAPPRTVTRPTLVDRLVAAAHGIAEPQPASISATTRALIDDIEDLLNTCSVASDPSLADYPEASRSLLTYGSPPPLLLAIATELERYATARQMETVLKDFELRLQKVRVKIDDQSPLSNEGRFRIEAVLRSEAEEAPVPFSVALRVRATSGRTQVITERS